MRYLRRSARPACRGGGARRGGEELARVDRLLAAAQLEMQLRLADPAGGADPGDGLAGADFVALLHQQLLAMGISRDPPAGMLDQHEVAVAAQLVAGIGDDAAIDRRDR